MKSPATGGRGKIAPYRTTHYRIPEPLKETVFKLSEHYRYKVTNYVNPNDVDLINQCLASLKPDNAVFQNQQLQEAHKQIAELKQQIEDMQNRESRQREILINAKKLKANAGGAIKLKIDEALNL